MVITAVALTVTMAASAAQRDAPAAALAWLTGCWASEGGESGSGEQWMAPAGGTLLGMSRTVRDGRTVAHEFLRIVETEDGSLAYIARPSGQPEARFELATLGEHEVVFENPRHDFPQRVVYRLDSGGVLRARIEGQRGEETAVVQFPMNRVRCDATEGDVPTDR
jgi:hypothetical protein